MKIATVLCPKGPSLMAVVEDPPEGFLSGPAAYICKLWRCKHIGFEIMPDFTEQHGNGGFPWSIYQTDGAIVCRLGTRFTRFQDEG